MSHARGSSISVLAPRSKLYRGPFGRICNNLDPWSPGIPREHLERHSIDFTSQHMTERPGVKPGDLTSEDEVERLENEFSTQHIPAGYTYFGQFVDHDITFDPTPFGTRTVDPNGLDNFRTPRLDLDCVYGSGPADQPFMYDEEEPIFLIGEVGEADSKLRDLPRNPQGRAIIGDMRNDENAMVSQTQLAFLLAHNTLYGRASLLGMAQRDAFFAARRTLTWLYQWVVWRDFLARVCQDNIRSAALELKVTSDGRASWELGFRDIYDWKYQPFMPIEFSAAAYRFGHSMVRNSYQTNFRHSQLDRLPIFSNTTSGDGHTEPDLRGFGPMTSQKSLQWDWFLQMVSSSGPFPQKARKIDTRLSNALLFLTENDEEPDHVENKLAARNLIRGVSLELPSGPDVAACLSVASSVALEAHEPEALWYYILKEAEVQGGERLGALGSTIVCAVFAGLLKGDPKSWVNVQPRWEPAGDRLLIDGLDNQDDPAWGLSSIIRLSGLPVSDADMQNETNGEYKDVISPITHD